MRIAPAAVCGLVKASRYGGGTPPTGDDQPWPRRSSLRTSSPASGISTRLLFRATCRGRSSAATGSMRRRSGPRPTSWSRHYAKRGYRISSEISYLNHILTYVLAGLMPKLNNKLLRELGAEIKFYPGLPEFFAKSKGFVPEKPGIPEARAPARALHCQHRPRRDDPRQRHRPVRRRHLGLRVHREPAPARLPPAEGVRAGRRRRDRADRHDDRQHHQDPRALRDQQGHEQEPVARRECEDSRPRTGASRSRT